VDATVARRGASFFRRTGVLVATGTAVVALLGYLLLTNYRSATKVRENLVAQRVQHVQSNAVAVGHLFASAAEDVRYLAESREVAAFYESRDLGMSMEYGLALSLVPIRERMAALVRPGRATPSRFDRIVMIDASGAVLADTARGIALPPASELLRISAPGRVVVTSDGRHLATGRPHAFKGRHAALFAAWLKPESVLDVLAESDKDSLFILDGAGYPYHPEREDHAGLPAGIGGIPADGRMVELAEAGKLRGGGASHFAVRVTIPGQDLSLVKVDRAEMFGDLSPVAGAVNLAIVACAVLGMLGISVIVNTRSLVLRARLDESLRRESEVAEKHAALEREMLERQRLEAAHSVLAMAVDRAAEAIAVTDAAGVVEYSNAAFQRIAGCAAPELRGRSVPHHFAELAADGRAPGLTEALTRTTPWKGELSGCRRDGTPFETEVVTSPVHDDTGAIVKYVLVARDVTEEKQLRDQLRHAQRLEAIGTLAGGVAHDFRNLLTAMKANAEFCMEGLPSEHPVRDDVQEILHAIGRAVDLTRQLLAFGRRQVLNPQVLEVNEVVTGVEKMLRRVIGEHVELRTAPAQGLRHVRADRGQLEQVLVNLAVNARDAMPAGGRLVISTHAVSLTEAEARRRAAPAAGDYVAISVTDSGVGMDAETLPRIFEPFFTTKPQGKGTGLGLSTVYGIVQQSRGFVTVRSAPNEGATFDIHLPAAVEARVVAVGSRRPPLAARSGNAHETILVVEDEEQVRAALRRQLVGEGYSVLTAADGRAAIALMDQHPRIDLLISDVVMPHVGGPELARVFRARHRDAGVILMSGYSDEAVARHGDLSPAAAFVQKPYEFPELARLVRKLLDDAVRTARTLPFTARA
jgi:PAS domain S-box-containing protein